MTANTMTQGPAVHGFSELAKIDVAEHNINARLLVLDSELREAGWRGRPAVEAVPGVSNGDRGVVAFGRIADLLREIPREQTAAAREGRPADVATLESELATLERRSETLRSEIRALVRERTNLPDQRRAVVRTHYPAFLEHAHQIAAERAAHADELAELARQLLEDRDEVRAAFALAQTGKPVAMPEHQAAALASSFAPWTTSRDLWAAIETVAGANTLAGAASGEPTESEAAA